MWDGWSVVSRGCFVYSYTQDNASEESRLAANIDTSRMDEIRWDERQREIKGPELLALCGLQVSSYTE